MEIYLLLLSVIICHLLGLLLRELLLFRWLNAVALCSFVLAKHYELLLATCSGFVDTLWAILRGKFLAWDVSLKFASTLVSSTLEKGCFLGIHERLQGWIQLLLSCRVLTLWNHRHGTLHSKVLMSLESEVSWLEVALVLAVVHHHLRGHVAIVGRSANWSTAMTIWIVVLTDACDRKTASPSSWFLRPSGRISDWLNNLCLLLIHLKVLR